MDAYLKTLSRRSSLGLLVGAVAAGSAAAAKTPGPVGARLELPLGDPAFRLEAYLRLRCRLDAQQTFTPYRGTIFGKPEAQVAVPLFDVEGFSWTRATQLESLRYRLDSVEAGYFLDRVTGQPLDRWTNPLNGLETTVKHYRSYAHIAVTPDALEPLTEGPRPAGTFLSATMGEPHILGDHLWMHEDLIVQFPSRPKASFSDPLEYFGPSVTATSLASWSAAVADVADRRLSFVPTTLAYQTLGSWRPFMRMGSAPGLISWRMFGAKVASLEEVPAALRERVLRDYPDFLTRDSADASPRPAAAG